MCHSCYCCTSIMHVKSGCGGECAGGSNGVTASAALPNVCISICHIPLSGGACWQRVQGLSTGDAARKGLDDKPLMSLFLCFSSLFFSLLRSSSLDRRKVSKGASTQSACPTDFRFLGTAKEKISLRKHSRVKRRLPHTHRHWNCEHIEARKRKIKS